MSRRRRKKNNRAGKLCVTVIVCTLLVVMSIQIVRLYQKNQEYIVQEKNLTEQLEEETQRQENLKDYEEYTKSQDYVEDIAKSKLGLLHDNEIVFKEKKK